MKICAVILAAGSGRRMELDTNKVFIKFEEQSAVIRCLKTFGATELFSDIIVACKAQERDIVKRKIEKYIGGGETVMICDGGAERQYSVRNALEFVPGDADIVVVHDAARCFVTERIIRDCVSSAIRHGSGVAAVKATDTIKRAKKGVVTETLPREELVCVQTPQAFRADLLKQAYQKAEQDGFLGTDDASLVERLGKKVHVVTGSPDNIKLTTRKDVDHGRQIVRNQESSDLRIGNGFDMHQFAQGRKLVLGGVTIPSDIGLDGHSDADVLVHAIMDALLGAARLGDIGGLFPDTDPQYKDIYSIDLLRGIGDLLRKYGYKIINIDSTIIMQKPKVSAYREQMMDNIAAALDMTREYVNVKATTTEYLGAVGRGEGAAAQAVCILQKQRR
ncbi:bifunctional 2-C-methyl-D-erythritol 4-phosphate cytidylyltransferase/2-C-methyl-D-erythritol 2,4-cyclodiphosphate synthase [Christensenella timonensis]|uniref:bifunctional 2-C-methyl-D-erythritol 4-phosphate cytidylyltransferase/2-C-methyl-D-erythritol 2,4-cyclodiphosphate synthase n=1 Tax=Christensenella timonensis TaxID=1816678 RepID=UPI00082F7145|nr:bifunctional 2-C-methyl-D-erythritol 4-phosphate cytidylyltransferase/2-C-methyl-D-erythritol 2,4-cyclodiphosphate synthase [Christensenella timonensis]